MSEVEIVEKKDVMPEEVELDETQIEVFDSLFDDLSVYLKKQIELQQMGQQLNQAMQQNNGDYMGTAKAIEKFIQTLIRSKGFVGNYVYNKEKKTLELNKNPRTQ